MKTIDNISLVTYPSCDIVKQFNFSTKHEDGTFNFSFKYLNDVWNCYVTLPDGSIRQCGVYPNVISWTGYPDYGILFSTDLKSITYDSLFLTELYIIKWV